METPLCRFLWGGKYHKQMPKISHQLSNRFEETAFSLFFEGNLPALAAQFQSIGINQSQPPSPRIALFAALMQPDSQLQLEDLFSQFLIEDDLDACCACVGGALMKIWDEGRDFSLYAPWLERSKELLQQSQKISTLAQAFLLLQQGVAEMTGAADLAKAEQSYSQQQKCAEQAGSASLQVLGAAAHAYCSTWSGNLARGELLLLDTVPLLSDPQLNPLSLVQHQITFAIIQTIQGKPQQAIGILQQILAHPMFPAVPPSLQLQAYNVLLDSYIVAGNLSEIDSIAEQIRSLAIPEQNNFFRSYLNFCLAMAALATGRPYRALAHAEEAHNRSKVGKSAIAERMSALLLGLTLSDLGRDSEALQHLEAWDERWQNAGYHLISALGRLETSTLYLRRGLVEKARTRWQQAHDLIQPGEQMFHLYRPEDFYGDLKLRLAHGPNDNFQECRHVVRIKTLGEFYLEINGQRLYDRDWKGRQTKILLKTLILYGGQKVAMEKIAAQLWPDADGDLAINSLNVTLSRLRKMGIPKNHPPIPWLASRHKKLSLIDNLCCIDALIFRNKMKNALQTPADTERLQQALDLYTGNFLAADTNLYGIETFRKELKQLYIKGVLQRAESLTNGSDFQTQITLLEQALSYDPLNEILYRELMQSHLKNHNRGKALEIYDRASKILATQLDTTPGQALQTLARETREQH